MPQSRPVIRVLPSSAQVPAPRVTLLLDQVHQMMNGHRFQSPAKVLALALAVFLAGCGGSHASTSPTGSPSHSTPGSLKPVAMPTVLGYSVPFAKHEIRSMGLKGPTKVIPTPNGSWPQYRITGTIPPAGKLVLADSPVTFYIASGPAVCIACTGRGMVVKMPDVCGKTFQEANTLLVEMGITLTRRLSAARHLDLGEPSSARYPPQEPTSSHTGAEVLRKSSSPSRQEGGRRRQEARVAADRRPVG